MKLEVKKTKIDQLNAKLKALQSGSDPETNHYEADQLLLHFLREIGLYETIAEFDKVKKWYA